MAHGQGIGEPPFTAAFRHPPTLFKRPAASYPPARKDLTMKLGLAIGYSGARPEVPVALVQRAEELGYDSVWSAEAGRSIDEDHYGAGFASYFGSRDAPGVSGAMDAYAKRTGRDATHAFAIGDADAILARLAEYVDVGVSKFILRPLGGDDDAILAQTRLLIEQVLPRAEAR